MGKRGRPRGGTSKSCLIRDKLIEPYEIHVDNANRQFILVDTTNKSNVGYYTKLTNALKAIMETKYVPTGGDGNVYTLREYIKAMSQVRDGILALMKTPYAIKT
tara:strand:+ start:43 stop:354 length:312 start_codon:yes stop_codon:yes gene_type:complete